MRNELPALTLCTVRSLLIQLKTAQSVISKLINASQTWYSHVKELVVLVSEGALRLMINNEQMFWTKKIKKLKHEKRWHNKDNFFRN